MGGWRVICSNAWKKLYRPRPEPKRHLLSAVPLEKTAKPQTERHHLGCRTPPQRQKLLRYFEHRQALHLLSRSLRRGRGQIRTWPPINVSSSSTKLQKTWKRSCTTSPGLTISRW